jgi:hypothetical protein
MTYPTISEKDTIITRNDEEEEYHAESYEETNDESELDELVYEDEVNILIKRYKKGSID